MMKIKQLTCICCPLGCTLTATVSDGEVTVRGNTCPKGTDYGKKEMTAPTRVVTGTVRLTGGVQAVAPVKTAGDVPKEKVLAVAAALGQITAVAPVAIGDVIAENAADTGVALVATKNIPAKG